MSDTPFSSLESFQHAFTTGLTGLLQKGGLGPFILVCANASFDKRVGAATAEGLKGLYEALSAEYVEALSSGKPIQAVEEDLLVFLKLHAVGFARLQATETRHAGPWEVQFNQLRSFRPKRITTQVPQTLHVPFDEAGFHFNKPFMQKEAFWSGKLSGRHATLYYNKYPFADFHGLLVPERESCLSQFLTEAHHFYLWQVTHDLSRTLEGVGFGYNSLGAFASVNHLHFQMFVKPAGLPVMAAEWQHNGGSKPYPTHCAAFDSAAAAWVYLSGLHDKNIPYNLLYSKERLYIFPRKKQGCYAQPEWTSGFAWLEMAGGMIMFNRESYASLDQATIGQELGKLAIAE
jgi:ATP adenylyltransferase/5',5'''-P-1,P-4-tetraphosphate phosphorylase II